MHAVIIGGGVGGLCAALALRKFGVRFRVYEKAPELLPVGSWLSIWSNAMKVLELLDLREKVEAAGAVLGSSNLCTDTGRILLRMRFSGVAASAGMPSIAITRAALQEILVNAVGQENIQLESDFTRITRNDGCVIAEFANGTCAEGDLLIGADGVHSTVRAQLCGPMQPRYAGYLIWRGLCPMPRVHINQSTSFESMGAGLRFGTAPVGQEQSYWFATADAPESAAKEPANKAALLRTFSNWHEPIDTLIRSTEESDIITSPVTDLPPFRGWSRGAAVLIGDAAHPSTPNLGQGACMAIEDALILAKCLKQTPEPVRAFADFENLRYPRTRAITLASRYTGQFLQFENALAIGVRNQLLPLLPSAFVQWRISKALAPLPGIANTATGS